MLHRSSASVGKIMTNIICLPSNGRSDSLDRDRDSDCESKSAQVMPRILLHQLEPVALQCLHQLISLVHDSVNVADHCQAVESTSMNNSAIGGKDEVNKIVKADMFHLEDDPVANIFWTLPPLTLQSVFLAMAHYFPRTLEALILHLLSPVGAETLTRKFDEIDQLTPEEDRNEFYRIFYGVFDNHFAAMDALLNRKELFARQAFNNVLDKYLGIDQDGPKSVIG